ncbi:hypothetical protein ASPZODRAFT_126788 [Penicilliopsis zonata CBS 506.65]|uniref:Uncharacterized protein n=1 Tax=Penicilliopsis zonata CBS 506.65 TaxID=1073090 RepID=A0A1L9SUG2_9EURO|nr:hypothetical protein ASPZODRAFT_126788 [Penicilliopsis zonata CBS 506.65]OJJ50838.1 hypothetical protein ASPZODRAFT_126788 [Penicilliopsis zonata CBS 506.65]
MRELFLEAVGMEVLVAGFVIILFEKTSQVKAADQRPWPCEIGGLRVFFDRADYTP